MVEKILNTEAILVQNLEATIKETKGFGSSDWEVTKQVGTSADLLTKPPSKETKGSLSESLSKKSSQDTPRPQMMTKQAATGAELLSKQSWKVTGPMDQNSPQND